MSPYLCFHTAVRLVWIICNDNYRHKLSELKKKMGARDFLSSLYSHKKWRRSRFLLVDGSSCAENKYKRNLTRRIITREVFGDFRDPVHQSLVERFHHTARRQCERTVILATLSFFLWWLIDLRCSVKKWCCLISPAFTHRDRRIKLHGIMQRKKERKEKRYTAFSRGKDQL